MQACGTLTGATDLLQRSLLNPFTLFLGKSTWCTQLIIKYRYILQNQKQEKIRGFVDPSTSFGIKRNIHSYLMRCYVGLPWTVHKPNSIEPTNTEGTLMKKA